MPATGRAGDGSCFNAVFLGFGFGAAAATANDLAGLDTLYVFPSDALARAKIGNTLKEADLASNEVLHLRILAAHFRH
jgi:hypothetical protein